MFSHLDLQLTNQCEAVEWSPHKGISEQEMDVFNEQGLSSSQK